MNELSVVFRKGKENPNEQHMADVPKMSLNTVQSLHEKTAQCQIPTY